MKTGHRPSTDDLREALMAAVEVARQGQKEKPPVEPPPRLKQFLNFNKFPARALSQVRAVVEDDEEFRERVAEAIHEKDMNRMGWLWLTRPDGWEEECAELAAAAQESEVDADAQRIHELEQSLQKATDAAEKFEGQRDKAVRERDEARLKARQASSEARRFDEQLQRLASELERMRGEQGAMQNSLERVQRKESRTEQKLKHEQKKNKQLRDSAGSREKDIAELLKRLATAEEEVAAAREAGFELPKEPETPKRAQPEAPKPLTHRTPAPLPPGMLKDTVEAVEHLLRTPRVVVLVDGYNVTFKTWQDMPVREQRMRLLQKLKELSARYPKSEVVVVFDGVATDYDYISTTARSLGVTVRFSPPETEADDVILGLCSVYPLWQPLVVVSHDSRVRDGARGLGANLVQPSKLLELMGVEMEEEDGFEGFTVR